MLEEFDDDHLEIEEYEEDVSWCNHTIDEGLDFPTKFEKYHTSSFASQRIVLLRELNENTLILGLEVSIDKLFPIFLKFATDGIPAVRKEYLVQLQGIALQFLQSDSESARLEVFRILIPSCFDLTVDENEEVSSCAVDTIVSISEHLDCRELEQSIFEIINLYAHDDRDEECRIVAIRIYNRITDRFDDAKLNLIVTELINLGDDMSCYVRCAVARNIHNVMKAAGRVKAYETLFPVFRDLCQDEIADVRVACAESFMEVIQTIDLREHAKETVHYLNFLLDSEYAIRTPMLRILGNFISALPWEYRSVEIVERFAEIPYYDDMNVASESCAHVLHEVLNAIGTERWDELKECFLLLYKSDCVRVKKAIAEKLHLLSQQFHTKESHENFQPAFQYFLESEDQVKMACIQHAHMLLTTFDVRFRENCLHSIIEILKSTQNWRIRRAVGKSLCELLSLCTPAFQSNVIIAVGLTMLRDSVAAVRVTGASLIAACVEVLSSVNYEIDFIVDQIGSLADSTFYTHRILFCMITEKIHAFSCSIFYTHFLQKLCLLSGDQVPNVRLRVAKVFTQLAHFQTENIDCLESIAKLRNDADEDVRLCISLCEAADKRTVREESHSDEQDS